MVHVLPTLHLVISIIDHTYAQPTLNIGGGEGLKMGSQGGGGGARGGGEKLKKKTFFSKVAQNRLKRILV